MDRKTIQESSPSQPCPRTPKLLAFMVDGNTCARAIRGFFLVGATRRWLAEIIRVRFARRISATRRVTAGVDADERESDTHTWSELPRRSVNFADVSMCQETKVPWILAVLYHSWQTAYYFHVNRVPGDDSVYESYLHHLFCRDFLSGKRKLF